MEFLEIIQNCSQIFGIFIRFLDFSIRFLFEISAKVYEIFRVIRPSSKHTISDSDFTILTSGNSKFDLEMRERLLISKLKPILNNNIFSMRLYLF